MCNPTRARVASRNKGSIRRAFSYALLAYHTIIQWGRAVYGRGGGGGKAYINRYFGRGGEGRGGDTDEGHSRGLVIHIRYALHMICL